MDNKKPGGIPPTVVIKISDRVGGHDCVEQRRSGCTPSHSIPFWTKWRWRAAYWRRAYGQTPDWRSPRWLAVGCALLLVLVLAAVSTAYEEETALRQRVAGMRVSSTSTGSTVPAAPQTMLTAVPPSIYATGSAIYIVQPDDTLYRIADRHGTTLEALDQINQLNSTISVGQVLVIPATDWGMGATAVPTDQYACAQFSFHQAGRGAPAGVYALHDTTGGQIAAWSAPAGAMASGWIYDLPVAFASVHARVLFYPRYGGGTAVEMNILNHAPDSTAGWLTRGLCHSLELAYP